MAKLTSTPYCPIALQPLMRKVAFSLERSGDVLAYRREVEAKGAFVKHVQERALLEANGAGFSSKVAAALESVGGRREFDLFWTAKIGSSLSSGAAMGFESLSKDCGEEISRLGGTVRDFFMDFSVCSQAIAEGALGPGKSLGPGHHPAVLRHGAKQVGRAAQGTLCVRL